MRFVVLILAVLAVLFIGAVAYFGFTDAEPQRQTLEIPVPNDRLAP